MSGIYIPGTEMPTSCHECGFEQEGFWCGALLQYEDVGKCDKKRHEHCPLIPVPPHGRLDYEGLKTKYVVYKASNGEPVNECFVLRPDKDRAAIVALNAYADVTDNQVLADDIRLWLSTIIPAEEGEG